MTGMSSLLRVFILNIRILAVSVFLEISESQDRHGGLGYGLRVISTTRHTAVGQRAVYMLGCRSEGRGTRGWAVVGRGSWGQQGPGLWGPGIWWALCLPLPCLRLS
jgi:hypothetical protein